MNQLATTLALGMPAPHFQTRDIFDQPIDLAAYAGQPVLLAFMRNAACALCNLRVHELIQAYPRLHANGLTILTVFESPAANIREYVGKQDAPFAIIADPEARLYDLYQVEVSQAAVERSREHPLTQAAVQAAANVGFTLTPEAGSNFYRMPAEFLIDGQGVIRQALYSDILSQHLPMTTIEAFLAR